MPNGRVSGKRILISGGAGGIGRAMALALLSEGGRVAAMDLSGEALSRLADDAGPIGGRKALIAIVANIAEERDCDRAVAEATAAMGGIDVLINTAGVALGSIRPDHHRHPVGFFEITASQWDRFFSINTKGPFLLTKAALPAMREHGWGRIINVTTSLDSMLRKNLFPYGPTKAALEASSAIWAAELAGSGVTVNVLTPGGPTNTGFIPAASGFDRSKMIQPDVMAAPSVWLASEESNGITGRRFVAVLWDSRLPATDAARAAGAPIGWPDAGTKGIWPT
ncbi:MAG: SDR family oxidoreductase [Alphaproteobacteria bacterium]